MNQFIDRRFDPVQVYTGDGKKKRELDLEQELLWLNHQASMEYISNKLLTSRGWICDDLPLIHDPVKRSGYAHKITTGQYPAVD